MSIPILYQLWIKCYSTDMTKHVKLTDEQLNTFAEARAAKLSPARAMIAAQPELVLNKNYANVKARRLMNKPDVKAKIDQKLQKLSKDATKRVEELIQSENENIATTNAWKVIEHNIGTPVKRSINANVQATIEDALF